MTDVAARRREVARGFASRRFMVDGWAWADAALHRLQGRPVSQARLLLAVPDPSEAIRRAQTMPDVRDIFWSEFSPYGLGAEFPLAETVARELLSHDRVTAALMSLNLYAGRAEPGVPAQLVVDALDALLARPPEDVGALSSYELEHLLDFVRSSGEIEPTTVAVLEWRLLPALDFDAATPTLHSQLARDPDLFIQMLSLCYRSKQEEPEPDVPQNVAMNAYHVLDRWRTVPGAAEPGAPIDEGELRRWLESTRRKAEERGRLGVADIHIGRVFAYAPQDDGDGIWPAREVRRAIESLASAEVEEGFATQIFNKRGVTSRSLTDGGRQEYLLADDFDSKAVAAAPDAPRTAAVLRSVADGYRAQARREDEEAERFRSGLGRR